MTTPDIPEPTCAHSWCRKPKSDRQHLNVGDLPNPYMSHHPFMPTEAPAPAAPSAWDREVAQMYDDIIDRGLHLKDGCSYDGDHPCTCYVKAHLDMVIAARVPGGAAGEALEAALREIVRHVYEEPMSEEHIVTVAQSALAAARVPGVAAGEAAEAIDSTPPASG